MCACVCMYEWERERDREGEKKKKEHPLKQPKISKTTPELCKQLV